MSEINGVKPKIRGNYLVYEGVKLEAKDELPSFDVELWFVPLNDGYMNCVCCRAVDQDESPRTIQ